MISRSEYREAPPAGYYEWPDNGEVYERSRVSLLLLAERADAEGRVDDAAALRAWAAAQKRRRDRCCREHERRVAGRRSRRGRY